jgi:Flp pilus assembly protein TadG
MSARTASEKSRVFSRVLSAWRSSDGVAAIEFAIIVPVFLVIFVGAVDLGRVLYTAYQLDSAVAAGAEYVAVNPTMVNSTNGATLASAVATVVENANGSGWANNGIVVNNGPSVAVQGGNATNGGTASNADQCYCPTGTPPNWSWGTAVTCGSACPNGGSAGKFVTITASVTYSPLLSTYGLVKNGTLTQSAVAETE